MKLAADFRARPDYMRPAIRKCIVSLASLSIVGGFEVGASMIGRGPDAIRRQWDVVLGTELHFRQPPEHKASSRAENPTRASRSKACGVRDGRLHEPKAVGITARATSSTERRRSRRGLETGGVDSRESRRCEPQWLFPPCERQWKRRRTCGLRGPDEMAATGDQGGLAGGRPASIRGI